MGRPLTKARGARLRVAPIAALAVLVALAALLLVLGGSLSACLATVDLTGLTPSGVDAADGAPTLYSIGGTVQGLQGGSISLAANGSEPLTASSDGAFRFETKLPAGASYIVTIISAPEGRLCVLQNGEGRVANADVTNVVVFCPSDDARLVDLTFSAGALSPKFAPDNFAYTAATQVPLLATARAVTVTATAASASAALTVNGMPATSGKPSAGILLVRGKNTISIEVKAADGVVHATYTVTVTATSAQEAYVKASNTREDAYFGVVALSSDGSTLAVGSSGESSMAIGVNGDQSDGALQSAGAVYVFTRTGVGPAAKWSQQAYLKPSNTRADTLFGGAVALSADGSTLVVGGFRESSAATGINGNQSDTSAPGAGAVYVFGRSGSGASATWSQAAYIKPSNARVNAQFGRAVALTPDGNTLAVGADGESSASTGINGNQSDTSAPFAGAVYLFSRTGTGPAAMWSQQAYFKASNPHAGDRFGATVALSSNGTTLAVGAVTESSAAKGINGDQTDESVQYAGAVYVFTRADPAGAWSQQAYIKASNTQSSNFGHGLALSADGSTLVVGAPEESGGSTGINKDQTDTGKLKSGAAYAFTRSGATWSQVAYFKASNARASAYFGRGMALSADGATLAVGSSQESSAATGIDGDQQDTTSFGSGAVYLFARQGTEWSQSAYVKASSTLLGGEFGRQLAMSSDGVVLAVGAYGDASKATGINGDQTDYSDDYAGAVYVFR